MTQPRFLVWLDNGDVSVESDSAPTALEGYDIARCRAFTVTGAVLRPTTDNGKEWGIVHFEPTDEVQLAELEAAVRTYVSGLTVHDTGDFFVDAANAIASVEWTRRWPRRPKWLAARIHGARPVLYERV